MLITGSFPTGLKFSEITPIFKRGDKNDTSNYRPISLLMSLSKIFEKVIYNRLYHHFKDNHILVNEQFGFRQASSTDCVSHHLINSILSELNNKLLVGGIFVTFTRHLIVLIMISCQKWNFMGLQEQLTT
jgi:hypothetical protein